jgi:phosphatidylserine/phosphatidylglycerophosphate/cardiolipin synthase-like enzyme
LIYITFQQQIDTNTIALATLQTTYDQYVATHHHTDSEYIALEQLIQYEIDVLTNQAYYTAVLEDIQGANDTIYVAMYSMKYDPGDSEDWANDLITSLVFAHNRGINVHVLIENQTFFDTMSDNIDAYQYLFSNGVDVQMDNDSDTDHMKVVIIDGYVVYVGSHNWSESALYHNNETSVKITSEDVADLFITYFSTIY